MSGYQRLGVISLSGVYSLMAEAAARVGANVSSAALESCWLAYVPEVPLAASSTNRR